MPPLPEINCVLLAQILGQQRLIEKLGQSEALRAQGRAHNRIMRSVEGHHGQALRNDAQRLIAVFRRADDAMQSAADMQEKLRRLPPVSGINLNLQIGIHCSDEAGGAAVALASRLADIAAPGQALLTAEVARHLSDRMRTRAFAVPDRSLHHEGIRIPLFGLSTQDDPATQLRLVLRHRDIAHVVTAARPILLIGRNEGNDIRMWDRRASRHHARIECRHGKFYLFDRQSTNGSFVLSEGKSAIVLRREECILSGSGKIGCGFSLVEDDHDEALGFEALPR